MNCQSAREAISALLDGEDPEVSLAALEAHVAGCVGCRAWRESAHEVTRRTRLGEVRPGGRVEVVLAGLPRARTGTQPGPLALARIGVVLVAVLQLAMAVPVLVFGDDHEAPLHVAHEMGSFDVALAVGFLASAWRPSRAAGMRTLVGAIAALLCVTAAIDVLGGRTTIADEAPHLLAVAGWLFLRRLARIAPPMGDIPLGVSHRRGPGLAPVGAGAAAAGEGAGVDGGGVAAGGERAAAA